MLNLKAFTLAVIIAVLTPTVSVNTLHQSSVLAQTQAERKAQAEQLLEQGNQQLEKSQFQEALQSFQQALEIYREIGDRSTEADILITVAIVYRYLGKYQQAIKFSQQSLIIRRELNNPAGEGDSLLGLAHVYSLLGQYQKAIEFYQQSLAIFQEIGDRNGEAWSLGYLGDTYYILGHDQQTIEFYQQALTIFQKIGDHNGETSYLSSLGFVYKSLGKYQQSIEYHQQSLSIHRETGNRQREAWSLSNLGDVYRHLKDYKKAIKFHQKALAIVQKISDCSREIIYLRRLGNTYSDLEQYEQAIESYQKSLTIARQIGDRDEEASSLENLGNVYHRFQQKELAIIFLKKSVDVTETIRQDIQGLSREVQESYTETVADRYRYLADLLLKENRVLEAQRVLDLLKVQELDDYLRNVRGNANTASGIEFYQPEQEILTRYNELQQNVIEIGSELTELQQKENLTPEEQQKRDRLDQLLTEVKQQFNQFSRSPEIRALIEKLSFEAREQTLSLGELDRLRDKLGELNAVLFYPLILEDRLELVITTPNSPPLRRTVNISQEELYQTIIRFRLALQDPKQDAVIPAQKLYQWLFEPLEDDLKAANTEVIIYAPDGALRYIPLVALHDGEQWLAQRFQVNNITAASLEEIDTQPQPQPKILAGAFADESLVRSATIGQRNVEFSGLPFAGVEVEGLKNTLPNTTTYIDEAFNLEAIKPQMNGYNVLHFATHAAFVPGDPSDGLHLF